LGTEWAQRRVVPKNDKGFRLEALDFAGCGGRI
jgi:hypothetical protein